MYAPRVAHLGPKKLRSFSLLDTDARSSRPWALRSLFGRVSMTGLRQRDGASIRRWSCRRTSLAWIALQVGFTLTGLNLMGRADRMILRPPIVEGSLAVGTSRGLSVYRLNTDGDLPRWEKDWSIRYVCKRLPLDRMRDGCLADCSLLCFADCQASATLHPQLLPF